MRGPGHSDFRGWTFFVPRPWSRVPRQKTRDPGHGTRDEKRATLAILTALTLTLPLPVWAQEPDSPLTLADTVLLARDNSLSAKVSRQRVAGAQAERGVTVGNALPQFSVQTAANYQELPGNAFGGLGGFGNLVGFPAQGVTVDTTLQGSVVIFDAFATRDAIAIADYSILVQRLAALQAEQDAMTNAAVAYFNVIRAEGLANVQAEAVRQAQEHLRLGDLRFRAGTGTRADVMQLRAQLANSQGNLTQARNQVNLARLQLSNAVNAPVADRKLLANPPVPPLPVALETDLRAGLDRRPEVQQLATQRQIDEAQVSMESRATWPNLQGVTRYSFRGLNQGQFLAGLTLNWALFDGFRSRNRMEVARNRAQADLIQLEQTRQNIALEIREQYQNREEATGRVAIAQEGLASAQEAYRLALKRFQVGLTTPFDLTDVQTTTVQAGNNYVQAVNDLRVAEIRLARAMGYDIAEFLTAGR